MFILTILCLIPIFVAIAGKLSWKGAIISTPILLFLLYFGYYWIGQYINILWFDSLGYGQVFGTILGTKWGAFSLTFLGCFLFYVINIIIMSKAVKDKSSLFTPLFLVVGGIIAIFQAIVVYQQWNIILLNNNAVPFGLKDPIFNNDISFYIFNLEFLRMIATTALFTAFIATVISWVGHLILLYEYIPDDDDSAIGRLKKRHGSRSDYMMGHVCGLGVILIGLFIWLRFLGAYGYIFDHSGVVASAGYTDIAKIGLNWWFIGFCVIAALIMLIASLTKHKGLAITSVSTILVMWIILMGIVPACIQAFVVKPNEFQVEQKYIDYNIEATRNAYNLNAFASKEINVVPLTKEIADANQPTLNNIRVWDWRAIADTYNQLQLFRTYYVFSDIDVDRYVVDGQYREVFLATREVDQDKLNEKTWINNHFVYTHGYGVVMNAVNDFTSKSEPSFIISDIPPKSTTKDISVKQPEIYFGKMTNNFAIINAQMNEFNYPEGDTNNQNRYTGLDGVKLDTFAKRLAFAVDFNDINILISGQISDESKMLWNRNIKERIAQITPFLHLDTDDYVVVRDNGSLSWIQDAYTVSAKYPYSAFSPLGQGINYVRNSVKVSVDAYNGTVNYYIFDTTDPVVKAYQKAFPTLFKSRQDMPSDLVKHIRYPEGLFTTQMAIYSTYHMTDTKVFYNKEDVWTSATEVFDAGEQVVLPYFVIATLPNSQAKDEFILMLPLTPLGRNNMIAWIGARCDGDNYGETLVYKFSKQQLIYGTLQVEAKINQKDEMASQFTLWSKSSTVIRGNTLVMPIGNSILYTQPVYLKSQEAKMPQIVRVIAGAMVNDNDNVDLKLEWGTTFDDALNKVLGGTAKPSIQPLPAPASPAQPDILGQVQDKLNTLKAELNSLIDLINSQPK